MKKRMIKELKDNRKYFLFSVLIALMTLLPQLLFSPFLIHTLFLLFTFIWLVAISTFSRTLFSIFVLFINGMNLLVGHIAIHWGYNNADLSPRFETIVVSPRYEMYEYLQTYIDYRDIFLILYTVVTYILLIVYLRHYRHTYIAVRKGGIGAFLLLIVIFSPYHDHIEKPEPFSIPSKYIKAYSNSELKELIIERKEYLHNLPIVTNKRQSVLYNKVVVVLGESVNKNHMGVYGYKYPTTPYLTSLYENDRLFCFDVIAPTNQTGYSVPILFTKATVHNLLDTFKFSASIFRDYKAAGYMTYWISNQGNRGDNTIMSIAEEADVSIFLNKGYYMDVTPDSNIIDALHKMKKDNDRVFYVLHLIGSHGAYNKRYSKERILFNPPKDIVEEYDNTIYYTDHILKEVLDYFQDDKLLLVYISDHGELINRNENGHGFLPAYKAEYEIPLLVYSSIKNSYIASAYVKNREHYFNMENFDQLVSYFSGLSEELNVSLSTDVMMVHPKNIMRYEKLR